MKNVQVVDGAMNSTFDIYEIPEDLFKLMFPDYHDIAFQDEVDEIFQTHGGEHIWDLVYAKKIDKKSVNGIHGTLHLSGSSCEKEDFPTRKEAEVLTTLPQKSPHKKWFSIFRKS